MRKVLRVQCPGVTLQRPVRLMHPRYALYVAPRPDHQFVVGATELESEDAGPVTLRSMLELGSALHSLHPAFGEARVLRVSAALQVVGAQGFQVGVELGARIAVGLGVPAQPPVSSSNWFRSVDSLMALAPTMRISWILAGSPSVIEKVRLTRLRSTGVTVVCTSAA